MAWVANPCLQIDVAEADPTFGLASAKLTDSKRSSGLTIWPVSCAELGPVFSGDPLA
jgi:hypothetical protein